MGHIDSNFVSRPGQSMARGERDSLPDIASLPAEATQILKEERFFLLFL